MTGDNVASAYDRWSTVYDHDGNPLVALEEPVVRAMLDDLPAINGLSALDLGCGTGRHALHLAERGARVTALDFSEGMLEQARAKPGAERIMFIHHDAAANPLPFEPASFDLLVSALVLEHVPDLAHFFAQSKRVLRPGAHAIFTAMHPAMMLRGAHARFTDPDSGDKIAPGSLPHQISDFVTAALAAGFQLEQMVEQAPDASLATSYPRAEKYIGWPMLLAMQFRA